MTTFDRYYPIALVGMILAAVLLCGCALNRGTGVITSTVLGLQLDGGASGYKPAVKVGLIRTEYFHHDPGTNGANVAVTTDAQHMGWNRSKVHHSIAVYDGSATNHPPHITPMRMDAFIQEPPPVP